MKEVFLNPFFIDRITDYQFLITAETQTKSEFLEKLYPLVKQDHAKTLFFIASVKNSTFETIRKTDTQILLNQ